MELVFEILDENGNVTLDLSNSITKKVGSSVVRGSGNVLVPALSGRRAWAVLLPQKGAAGVAIGSWFYRAWVEENRVYYSTSGSGASVDHLLIYGVY